MKTFRLFKRRDDGTEMPATEAGYKERPYYFRFTFRGKSYLRCLETNDAAESQRRSRLKFTEITQAITRGELERLQSTVLRKQHRCPLLPVVNAYRQSPSDASPATRENNIHALRAIVGEITASVQEHLSPAVVRAYFARVNQAALAEADQIRSASLRRSANSQWAKAKSLFTGRCLAFYQDLALLDDHAEQTVHTFIQAGNVARFSGRSVPKVFYNPPPDAVIRETLAAWEKLAEQDRDLFLAIGHELAFGLRISEFAQARWGWHTVRAGYPVLDGRASVKNGSGLIQVRALDPWFSYMSAQIDLNAWRGEPGDYIVSGTDAYRKDALFRAVSDWLRHRGWETQKTNHALRAYAGSQIAMKYGIYEAQMFLRHSTVKVTEQSYSHFVAKFKPANLDDIPARWAVVTASPVAHPALRAGLAFHS